MFLLDEQVIGRKVFLASYLLLLKLYPTIHMVSPNGNEPMKLTVSIAIALAIGSMVGTALLTTLSDVISNLQQIVP